MIIVLRQDLNCRMQRRLKLSFCTYSIKINETQKFRKKARKYSILGATAMGG